MEVINLKNAMSTIDGGEMGSKSYVKFYEEVGGNG